MKTLFLRTLPYFISMGAGVLIYIITIVYIENEDLSGLISNIAAGLLSIPLVFICYEVVANIANRNIKRTLAQHFEFEANHILIDIIAQLKVLLNVSDNLDKENLDKFLNMNETYIKKNINLSKADVEKYKNDRNNLLNLIYKQQNTDSLSDARIQNVLAIIRVLGVISEGIEHSTKHDTKNETIKAVSKLLEQISQWLDLCEQDAMVNHYSFNFV